MGPVPREQGGGDMTNEDAELFTKLLVTAERNWQVAEDEGYEDRA